VVADVRDFKTTPKDRFDFILVNSFLHHSFCLKVVLFLAYSRAWTGENSPALWRNGARFSTGCLRPSFSSRTL
jgi:hypothetical protein